MKHLYNIRRSQLSHAMGSGNKMHGIARQILILCTYMNFYKKDYINIHTTNLVYVPFVILLSKFIINILVLVHVLYPQLFKCNGFI